MGAGDILKNSNTDLDAARARRENKNNPPEHAAGQGLFPDDEDIFSSAFNVTPDTSSFGGLGGAGTPFGVPTSPFGMPVTPPTPQVSSEDKIFEGLGKAFKGLLAFFKDLVSSVGKVTPKFWANWGTHTFLVGLIMAVVGVIMLLFGLSIGLDFLIGGLLASAVGVVVLMFMVDKAKECTSKYKDGNDANFNQPLADETAGGDDDGYFDDEDDGFYGGAEDAAPSSTNSSFLDAFDFSAMKATVVEPPVSKDKALSDLAEVPKGMYSRQYLYNALIRVLPNKTPDFATNKNIDSSSDTFLQWEAYLQDAAEATGIKEEFFPELETLNENLFTIILTCTRPQGLKHDAVATELSKIYAYASGEYNPNVYAKSDAIGKKCRITIYTGESEMITLRDMCKSVEDFMLDTDNYMPVVLGVNPSGVVIKYDFKKLESILITGMPRMGKSWYVQCILTQMCALVSPTELHIYICDPKEGISDFKSFSLPHVKKFVSGDSKIVATLREVVRVEAPRRRKIIGDAGFVNIWDYKERNPNTVIPVIYVLIDEVVTLAERMEKETKQEFQGLLIELISQLPALGIRAFLIPHVVKNDIIAKTATDLIPCRVSVCGDANHIEACTGTKPKDFPYKLTNKGDMAVKMLAVSPETMYIHAPVLSLSNTENGDLFIYLRKLWQKLEPQEANTSIIADAIEKENASRTLSQVKGYLDKEVTSPVVNKDPTDDYFDPLKDDDEIGVFKF